MKLQLPQQSYQSRSKPFSSERLLNMLFEPTPQDKSVFMLIGSPGLKEYYDLGGNQRILGMVYLRNFLVYVTTDVVRVIYKREDTGQIIEAASKRWANEGWQQPTSFVQMCCNGNTVMMVNPDNKKLYMVDLRGEYTLDPNSWNIATVTVPNPDAQYTSVTCISGVFVAACQIGSNSIIQYTDVLGTEMLYDFQLDTALTNLSALASNMRELWGFGSNSIEVIAPTGEAGADFFAHVPGAYLNKGCVCKNSIATFESTFLFYGTDNDIYTSNGYGLTPISTPALLEMIKSWGTLDSQQDRDSVVGQVYSQDGHTYYVLKFKKFGKTIQYDLTTASWAERETGDGGEWEGEFIVRRPNGEMIVSSATTDKLYTMDSSYYTDNDVPICREFVFPTLRVEGKKRLFFYGLTLDVDVGLGPNDKVMLSWSDDGGYTWCAERMLGMGRVGEYRKKLQFRRLGSSSLRTFKVRFSTASMVNVLSASVEAEEGLV